MIMSTTTTTSVTTAKVRGVFGRVRTCLHERDYVFEQRKDGVYFKPLYGRRWAKVSFSEVADLYAGQFPLFKDSQTMPTA